MAWRTRGLLGAVLEEQIDLTNEYYAQHGFARVNKISTPVKVMELNEKRQIVMGYYEKKSTVDYIGLAQGVALCFDAKETDLLSFPLKNIHSHQLEYMRQFRAQGGLSFLIIQFKRFNETFLVPLEMIEPYFEEGARRSIPHEAMNEAIPIGLFQGSYLNYLAAVNVYLEKIAAHGEETCV